MSHKFEKRCEARQNEIRAGSVLAHVTKRIAAITRPRALVVLRFLLNTTEETDRIWPNPTTPCYLTNDSRSAEIGEIFGLMMQEESSKRRSPNILLIMTDQHNARCMSCAVTSPMPVEHSVELWCGNESVKYLR